ncbi:MAG: hypothetical protein WCJ23_03305, partial [Verrucomicrobiota bacterium]
ECNLAKVDVEGSNPFARSGVFFPARGVSRIGRGQVFLGPIPSPAWALFLMPEASIGSHRERGMRVGEVGFWGGTICGVKVGFTFE